MRLVGSIYRQSSRPPNNTTPCRRSNEFLFTCAKTSELYPTIQFIIRLLHYSCMNIFAFSSCVTWIETNYSLSAAHLQYFFSTRIQFAIVCARKKTGSDSSKFSYLLQICHMNRAECGVTLNFHQHRALFH
jgi:hypothetical protein